MDEQSQHDVQIPAAQSVQKMAPAQNLAIPISIVIGFGLIAAAIFFSGTNSNQQAVVPAGTDTESQQLATTGPIRPVDENDHIRGNPNAPIMIVEYSDYDCPFCKNFHETMNKIMDNYGSDGKVAWTYRHFPIEKLHPSAPRIALASECVALLGGNDAFWKFSDLVFGERGTNEPTNTSRLTEFATTAGVSATAFDSCVADERTKAAVEEDIADGINAGAKGTPYTLVLVGGQQGIINGAQPYEYVSNIMDTIIAQMEGQTPVAQ